MVEGHHVSADWIAMLTEVPRPRDLSRSEHGAMSSRSSERSRSPVRGAPAAGPALLTRRGPPTAWDVEAVVTAWNANDDQRFHTFGGRGFAGGRRFFLLAGNRIGPRADQEEWGPWLFGNRANGTCPWPRVQLGDRVRVVLGDQTSSRGYNNRVAQWWVAY